MHPARWTRIKPLHSPSTTIYPPFIVFVIKIRNQKPKKKGRKRERKWEMLKNTLPFLPYFQLNYMHACLMSTRIHCIHILWIHVVACGLTEYTVYLIDARQSMLHSYTKIAMTINSNVPKLKLFAPLLNCFIQSHIWFVLRTQYTVYNGSRSIWISNNE